MALATSSVDILDYFDILNIHQKAFLIYLTYFTYIFKDYFQIPPYLQY